MSTREDYPAFPTFAPRENSGMSLRDYFAAQAMASMDLENKMADDAARDAYWIADAMLAERAK